LRSQVESHVVSLRPDVLDIGGVDKQYAAASSQKQLVFESRLSPRLLTLNRCGHSPERQLFSNAPEACLQPIKRKRSHQVVGGIQGEGFGGKITARAYEHDDRRMGVVAKRDQQ